MTEVWDAYDENRKLIPDKFIIRENFSTMDAFHLVVDVLIIHQDNSLLFMHRSADKESNPNLYEASAGGSVLKGENSQEAAIREVKEETGLDLYRLDLLYQYSNPEHHGHYDRYLARTDCPKHSIVYQEGETDGHIWVKPEDLESFFATHKVLPGHEIELRLLFGLD
ncbi:NUDIX hydrolase [Streptococcus ferus]|uniref:NUDIX hydrolase n=1 Tax=Streptococcus ferus TaxID=1345 RepID=UPI0035A18905